MESLINGKYHLENRRYIGNKNKLLPWINNLLIENNIIGGSFMDVFAGTGIVSKFLLDNYNEIILNDFLYSNEVIYKAFFLNDIYDANKINDLTTEFQLITKRKYDDSYFEESYGGKFFSFKDAEIIGEIRERIQINENLNEKEKSILIASLIYSADKVSNTVGHYDAFRKKTDIKDRFKFELIQPINTRNKNILIYREDANQLVKNLKSDVAFIDPPYNSRQYSRFYHVLEILTTWKKPELFGVARKPAPENVSEYCKTSAPKVFDDLIKNLDVKYIIVTYNNTYNSKSSSSKNKITHDQIKESLNSVGVTKEYEKPFRFFNSGKTDLKDHKEYVFITKVKQ